MSQIYIAFAELLVIRFFINSNLRTLECRNIGTSVAKFPGTNSYYSVGIKFKCHTGNFGTAELH